MAGVVGGDCRDKMVDRLPRSYSKFSNFELYLVVDKKPVEVTCVRKFCYGKSSLLEWYSPPTTSLPANVLTYLSSYCVFFSNVKLDWV